MGNWFSADTREAQQLSTSSTDMGIQLKVCGIRGEKKTIHLCDTEEQLNSITVLQLKEKIIEKFGYQWQPSGAPVSCVFPELRLIFRGRELEEPALLSQCGIRHTSKIDVTLRLPGGGPLPACISTPALHTVVKDAAEAHRQTPQNMVVKVIVAGLRGDKMEIDLCDTEEQFESITVLQLKEEIQKRQPDCGDPERIRLIFTGIAVDDNDALLSAYGIQHMSVIHMVVRVPGGSVYPWPGHGEMGDKGGKNRSMERLASV